MNYELAQELKEAGFPQGGAGEWATGYVEHPPITGTLDEPVQFYMPTLSELIEACGDKFTKLETNTLGVNDSKWAAWSGDLVEFGSTLEEAVARLWLALNKTS